MGDRLMCATARRDLDAVARIILRDQVAVDSKNAYGLTAFMQVSPSFQVLTFNGMDLIPSVFDRRVQCTDRR